ncbi:MULTISPECIES: hypothetical protein [Mumia]|uniref:DUF4440 domain-containing protein n=1 Tax=Mumia xiangluensis TaxID=1678900 RepID=A0ABW1QIY9_9ACTN|nr:MULTISPECIES: hypothetical protein [Mumia]
MDPVSLACAAIAVAGATTQSADWMDRLDVLDDSRSAAFVRADPSLLDDVYAAGGRLRDDDAAMIRQYAARGLEIEDVRFDVLRFGVLQASERRAVLRVVDRMRPVRVRRAGGAWRALPSDRPTERRIVLVRTPLGWRISAVERLAG